MLRGGVGNALLAPISEVLSRLLVHLFTTAMAAKDVLIEQAHFTELSRFLERIVPVLRELQEKNVRDKPSIRLALESLEREIKCAHELISECTNKSRIYLLYNCRDIVKRLQDVTQEIGRCLSLIPMATLDISLDTQHKTVELYKLMLNVEFKAAVAEEEIIAKLSAGMREGQSNRDSARDVLLQIAKAVGVSHNPASLQIEMEKLREEKEEKLLRKSQAEAVILDQIIGFLSQAETLHVGNDRRQSSFRRQALPASKSFYCPFTGKIMDDPVEIASGQTVEREAIEAWFTAGHTTCPITKSELQTLDVQPNVALRNCIKEWRDRNTRARVTAAKSKLQSDAGDDPKLKVLTELHSISEERPIHRVWIQEEGLVFIIVSLLSSSNKRIRRTAFTTLCSLAAASTPIKEEIAEAGAINYAVRSLARDPREGREAVALLLGLAEESLICERIGKVQGCILLLVTMANSQDEEAANHAKKLLRNLSNNIQNVVQMAEANFFKPLVHFLLEGSEMTKILMASALARMGLTDQSKLTIVREGAIPPLVKMMSASKLEAKTAALGALLSLSTHPGNRDPMINAGVVSPLLQLLFSVTSVFMNLKEQAAETLANLATAGPMESNVFDSDETICQLLSLLNLVGPINQGHLLRALHGMASSATASSVRVKMREGSAIQLLLPFCESKDDDVRVNSVKLLWSLSHDWEAEEFVDFFGPTYIHALVKLLGSSREDERVAAVGIISNLPDADSKMTELLQSAEALPAIIHLLNAGVLSKACSRIFKDQLMETASRALIRFTRPADMRLQHLTSELGAIPLLVQALTVGSQLAKKEAATVLTQFSENSKQLSVPISNSRWCSCFSPSVQEGCRVHKGHCSIKNSFCLVEAGAIAPLVEVLQERESEAHEAALAALATLMKDETWESGAELIAESQGLMPIVRVLTVGTPGVKERATWMLERFFRVERYRTEVGLQAQMPLIDLAQKGALPTRSLAAKGLAHLKIIHNQSTYF